MTLGHYPAPASVLLYRIVDWDAYFSLLVVVYACLTCGVSLSRLSHEIHRDLVIAPSNP